MLLFFLFTTDFIVKNGRFFSLKMGVFMSQGTKHSKIIKKNMTQQNLSTNQIFFIFFTSNDAVTS